MSPINRSALEDYIAGLDPRAVPTVRAVDAAIRAAHPDFDVAVKYRILMYAIGADWRHWVVAIDAARKALSLRFLAGVLLSDPLHVLRPGSSVLMTWDIPFGAAVDAAAIGDYVREAVAKYPEFKANEKAILATARQRAAKGGRRPPAGG